MSSLSEQLDAQIAAFFSTWDVYTTVLALGLAAFVIYPILTVKEPDTHPLLLARQARAAPVRQPKESAVYRSTDSAYGFPLRSGLNVKDPDTPKWAPGRDGDLRDIWRSAVAGGSQGEKGIIMTISGKEGNEEHSLADISKSINAVGKHLQKQGKKVAIYMPNRLEYLSTVFAAAFYGLASVLLPYNQPHDVVVDLITQTGSDCLVAEAGSLPLESLAGTKVKHVIWVVSRASRHMDWSGTKKTPTVSTWHELVEQATITAELPKNDVEPANVTQVWLTKQGVPGRVTEFRQSNLIAAIAGLGVAVPQKQRIGPADLVLAADSFSSSYVLCNVLAAIYSHASLAINSVAGPGVSLKTASLTVAPTVIIASAETMAAMHKQEIAEIKGTVQRFVHGTKSKSMVAGRMPSDTWLVKLLSPSGTAESHPGRLRLILVAERTGTDAPPLSSQMLSDLRIFNRSRICYALTAPDVAGAVSQTNLYDYRVDKSAKYGQFGAPLSCCEVKLTSSNDKDVDGNSPKGEINVTGPSVVGGAAKLGVQGRFTEDCTLAHA